MSEDIAKLTEAFMDPAMTGESRAKVLAYARGLLDAQRELQRKMSEVPHAEPEKTDTAGDNYFKRETGN
jgi:hypothetical protein